MNCFKIALLCTLTLTGIFAAFFLIGVYCAPAESTTSTTGKESDNVWILWWFFPPYWFPEPEPEPEPEPTTTTTTPTTPYGKGPVFEPKEPFYTREIPITHKKTTPYEPRKYSVPFFKEPIKKVEPEEPFLKEPVTTTTTEPTIPFFHLPFPTEPVQPTEPTTTVEVETPTVTGPTTPTTPATTTTTTTSTYVPLEESWFSEDNKDLHYAVLLAGSLGYSNYRHQADVCHAYQILKERGFDDDHIITMVYDDIAYSRENPYPGQIFNVIGGNDVYPGCPKDYTGRDVNKDTLFAVLSGDTRAVRGIGSGRVIEKNSKQTITLIYSDHGSEGALGMPSGGSLYANELNSVLEDLVDDDHFKELIFYLESCEAGSMFEGFLKGKYGDKIYVIAAANAHESSWASQCPGDEESRFDRPSAQEIGTCLGDLFSVSWMQYTENTNITHVILDEQIEEVTELTLGNGFIGSHVTLYGDDSNIFKYKVVANYLSYLEIPVGYKLDEDGKVIIVSQSSSSDDTKNVQVNRKNYSNKNVVSQYDADLVHYKHIIKTSDDEERVKMAQEKLDVELKARELANKSIRGAIKELVQDGKLKVDKVSRKEMQEDQVEILATEKINRVKGQQVVSDWQCFKDMVENWHNACTSLTTYAFLYNSALINLCNLGIDANEFDQVIKKQCIFST